MAYNWAPDTSSLTAFTNWYNTHSSSMTQEMKDRYQPKLNQLASLANPTAWPTYTPLAWQGSDWQTRYNTQKTGMDALLSKIQASPTASDTQAAMDQVAQMYGYSPASWTALQGGMADRFNASNVMTNAANAVVGLQNTEFGQQQTAGMKAAQQEAVAGMQKQLESIFGARGGAGFAQAYETTNQLQSAFLQQQSQNNINMFDRALSAVNSENGYYADLILKGAIQTQDYLKFRWDALQTGYQDYIMAMDQTMKDWQTQENVNEQQYKTATDAIAAQMNAISSALASEMGVDESILNQMQATYNYNATITADTAAANEPDAGTITGPDGTPIPNPISSLNTASEAQGMRDWANEQLWAIDPRNPNYDWNKAIGGGIVTPIAAGVAYVTSWLVDLWGWAGNATGLW